MKKSDFKKTPERRRAMRRIIVIGSSGAGKTTLARELSANLNIPHTELDSLYHQSNWRPASDEEFLATVRAVTDVPAWILCGNFYSKIGKEIWPKADTIVWCDYSFARVFSQLFLRTLRRSTTKVELWNGNRESFRTSFFTKDSILMWMLQRWRMHKRRNEELFSHPERLPGVTLLRLKTPKDAREIVSSSM